MIKVFIFLNLLFSQQTLSAAQNEILLVKGLNQREFTQKNIKIKLEIHIETAEAVDFPIQEKDRGWGAEKMKQFSYIKNFKVWVNGNEARYRLSAISDIFNLRSLTINFENNKHLLIELKGGDASVSYNGIMRFDSNNNLIYRSIRHGEFQEIKEESSYFFLKASDFN